MAAALLILLVMALVVAAFNPGREGWAWFQRLRRPTWLTFEGLIPLIWISIYACFALSAWLCWAAAGRWDLMAGFLLLLVLVQSYTWVICRSRSLRSGTVVGLLGWIVGIALTIAVGAVSRPAAALLVPYLLWSPVGTFVTWRMERLNR